MHFFEKDGKFFETLRESNWQVYGTLDDVLQLNKYYGPLAMTVLFKRLNEDTYLVLGGLYFLYRVKPVRWYIGSEINSLIALERIVGWFEHLDVMAQYITEVEVKT